MALSALLSVCYGLFVYLSLLQLAAVIGIHHLPLSENIQASDASFTMPIACATIAPKRELNLGTRRARIDIQNARRDITHSTLHMVNILCIDGTGKPISGIVVHRNSLIK